ncbi:general odorant-binding protein 56d-like [Uranotaenia lowii]|uniref:general odorant-binding protein 56d-like n=1 Tax=Uranotaenia lowii TaxID=190385 RepID=UPI002479ED6F|nr:general odorant-binding protein 56d-like [Uranotaenia lowii]
MYKYLILCLVIVLGEDVKGFSIQQRQQGDAFALQCMAETGANPVKVGLLKIGDFSADDRKSRCFMKCFFEKEGFLNKTGDLQVENIVQALSNDFERSKVEAVIAECLIHEKDNCDTAFRVYECFYKHRESL